MPYQNNLYSSLGFYKYEACPASKDTSHVGR